MVQSITGDRGGEDTRVLLGELPCRDLEDRVLELLLQQEIVDLVIAFLRQQ